MVWEREEGREGNGRGINKVRTHETSLQSLALARPFVSKKDGGNEIFDACIKIRDAITRRSYRGGRSRRTEPHSICRNLFIPTRASVYGVYKIETIERVEFCVEWVINY